MMVRGIGPLLQRCVMKCCDARERHRRCCCSSTCCGVIQMLCMPHALTSVATTEGEKEAASKNRDTVVCATWSSEQHGNNDVDCDDAHMHKTKIIEFMRYLQCAAARAGQRPRVGHATLHDEQLLEVTLSWREQGRRRRRRSGQKHTSTNVLSINNRTSIESSPLSKGMETLSVSHVTFRTSHVTRHLRAAAVRA